MLLLTTRAILLVSLLGGFCLSFVLAIREAFGASSLFDKSIVAGDGFSSLSFSNLVGFPKLLNHPFSALRAIRTQHIA